MFIQLAVFLTQQEAEARKEALRLEEQKKAEAEKSAEEDAPDDWDAHWSENDETDDDEVSL